MTNQNREKLRKILKFLTPRVARKGAKDFEGFKFSFENLARVDRDDEIRASRGKKSSVVAKSKKISRNQVYKIWRRK